MINNGFTPDKDDYEFCTKVDNMIIPTEGFMGLSAATGGLAGIVTPELGELEEAQQQSRRGRSLFAAQSNLFSLNISIE